MYPVRISSELPAVMTQVIRVLPQPLQVNSNRLWPLPSVSLPSLRSWSPSHLIWRYMTSAASSASRSFVSWYGLVKQRPTRLAPYVMVGCLLETPVTMSQGISSDRRDIIFFKSHIQFLREREKNSSENIYSDEKLRCQNFTFISILSVAHLYCTFLQTASYTLGRYLTPYIPSKIGVYP